MVDANQSITGSDEPRRYAESPSSRPYSSQEGISNPLVAESVYRHETDRSGGSPVNVSPLQNEKILTQHKIAILRRRLAQELEALARIDAELQMYESLAGSQQT